MEKLIQQRGKRLIVKVPTEVDHYFADAVREEVDRRLQMEDVNVLELSLIHISEPTRP